MVGCVSASSLGALLCQHHQQQQLMQQQEQQRGARARGSMKGWEHEQKEEEDAVDFSMLVGDGEDNNNSPAESSGALDCDEEIEDAFEAASAEVRKLVVALYMCVCVLLPWSFDLFPRGGRSGNLFLFYIVLF